ncbi:tyrosine-type recombinase/integrase [Phenylobacterium sp.]|uniref:tyrosine-type recombinase/integrase n=1 Tax=Phenylobacterium sp. TaxID=1871053 RepID=UPI00272F5167|nr:tyrosine-type recombinase/integrase [Phenylobacterium sp.]MDP2214106.1 tyrosine-type recombinase/integrase [Phenylobacterium sp.]
MTAYWYAWRGGPQILKVTAASDALLQREIARALPDAIAAYRAERTPSADRKYLYSLVTRYLESPEFAKCAPRTQRDRRKQLDRVRADLGEMELVALEAKKARATLIAWRDKFKEKPKTADDLLGALSLVLSWAVDRGEIRTNPVKGFSRIYSANRADVIWTPEDLATIRPHCAPELNYAIRLAVLTGLRQGDLLKVTWAAVREDSIVWQTAKSRRRRTAVIPITDELRALLAEIPRCDSVTILNSSRKRPWTQDGLNSAIQRAKADAKDAAIKSSGDPEASTGLEDLRWNDLRGTAATNFIRAGLPLADVATMMGWEPGKVQEIALRYVTSEEFGKAAAARMPRNTGATEV